MSKENLSKEKKLSLYDRMREELITFAKRIYPDFKKNIVTK